MSGVERKETKVEEGKESRAVLNFEEFGTLESYSIAYRRLLEMEKQRLSSLQHQKQSSQSFPEPLTKEVKEKLQSRVKNIEARIGKLTKVTSVLDAVCAFSKEAIIAYLKRLEVSNIRGGRPNSTERIQYDFLSKKVDLIGAFLVKGGLEGQAGLKGAIYRKIQAYYDLLDKETRHLLSSYALMGDRRRLEALKSKLKEFLSRPKEEKEETEPSETPLLLKSMEMVGSPGGQFFATSEQEGITLHQQFKKGKLRDQEGALHVVRGGLRHWNASTPNNLEEGQKWEEAIEKILGKKKSELASVRHRLGGLNTYVLSACSLLSEKQIQENEEKINVLERQEETLTQQIIFSEIILSEFQVIKSLTSEKIFDPHLTEGDVQELRIKVERAQAILQLGRWTTSLQKDENLKKEITNQLIACIKLLCAPYSLMPFQENRAVEEARFEFRASLIKLLQEINPAMGDGISKLAGRFDKAIKKMHNKGWVALGCSVVIFILGMTLVFLSIPEAMPMLLAGFLLLFIIIPIEVITIIHLRSQGETTMMNFWGAKNSDKSIDKSSELGMLLEKVKASASSTESREESKGSLPLSATPTSDATLLSSSLAPVLQQPPASAPLPPAAATLAASLTTVFNPLGENRNNGQEGSDIGKEKLPNISKDTHENK